MDLGFFKVIVPAGPVRLFGEKVEMLPNGFTKPVDLSVFRLGAGAEAFAAAHFSTGVIIGKAISKRALLNLVDEDLVMTGEEAFAKRIADAEVINTELESAYRAGEEDAEKV
ncbi:MAG: hypothetical protein KGI03_00840 [Patescibacteria group bacterium]|nr:hypothetical protein [Patescibacteria group bacterium]